MNINFFTPPEKDFPQRSETAFDLNSFPNLILKILNENILSSFTFNPSATDMNLFILPIIFISFIVALSCYITGKKAMSFVDLMESIDHVLNKIIRQILEFFPFGVIFILMLFFKDKAFSADNLYFIFRPMLAVILITSFFILAYIVILFVFLKNETPKFLLGFLGAGLMALVTGNTVATIIPLTEHIKKNHGVNKEFADIFAPLGMIINKSGTVIVSTVALISLIRLYSEDIFNIGLQVLFFAIIFIFSLLLDGANSNGFIMLVTMILNIPMLHLEGNSYLLFSMSLPIFNRIGLFIDALSTALIITIAAKFTDNIDMPKFVEFI
jgi:Na+/H+-dicarboxylate symporter